MPDRAASPVWSALADISAALVVAAVVPLALLQVPDAVAWAIPPRFTAQGALRVSGLALCAMAVAAPLGGLAVRRFRAWPVLVTGLGIIGVADVLGNTARTIPQVGIDRSLHGTGAGLALIAAVALAAERPTRTRRLLACWQSVCVVAGLVAAPELLRQRLAGGNWQAALQPYPWLTGVALGLAALYAVLADDPVTVAARNHITAAERAQLALLTPPVAGMTAIAIAVGYGRGQAITAAAIAAGLALSGLTFMTARAGRAGWFALACAVAGFTAAPAARAAADLLRITPRSGLLPAVALGGAALCGAGLAVALPARQARLVVAGGLSLAAAGFAAGYLAGFTGAGLTRPGDQLLVAACAAIAGGLTAALTMALRGTGPAGTMCGTVLMLAGVLVGYLADRAIQLQATSGRWNIIAVAVTVTTALVVLAQRTPGGNTAGAPDGQAGRTPDHG